MRFRRVPVKIPAEAPKVLCGSGGFRCRYLVELPEGYGADTCLGSRGFWCRCLVRFWKFPVQLPNEVPEGLGEDAS